MLKALRIYLVLLSFLLNSGISSVGYAQFQEASFNLPQAGKMLEVSARFTPASVKGISIYPNDTFKFDFIIDTGDTAFNEEDFKVESKRLIEYFMASLTVPEKEDWVNLSPYEKQRIIPDSLGVTSMGRDMLAQDYMLKQLTASLINPQEKIGHEFWNKVYAQAQAQFGTTNIPVNTFNKVWIVPSQAVVWEHGQSAFVIRSHLKVMLDEDYLAYARNLRQPGDMFPAKRGTCPQAGCLPSEMTILKATQVNTRSQNVNKLGSRVIREILIPAIEKEVNEDKNFATFRQIFNSAILAAWYKEKLKQSILNQVYADKNKVRGIDDVPRNVKQKIYERYLLAFKKGAYSFIKEEINPITHQSIPRKYFSGGVVDLAQVTAVKQGDWTSLSFSDQEALGKTRGSVHKVTVNFAMAAKNQAMLARVSFISPPDSNIHIIDCNREQRLVPATFNIFQTNLIQGIARRITPQELGQTVLAYKASWANNHDPNPLFHLHLEDIQGGVAYFRGPVYKMYGFEPSQKVRNIYDGPMDRSSALRAMQMPDLDGFLLDAKITTLDDLEGIIAAAAQVGPKNGRIPYIAIKWDRGLEEFQEFAQNLATNPLIKSPVDVVIIPNNNAEIELMKFVWNQLQLVTNDVDFAMVNQAMSAIDAVKRGEIPHVGFWAVTNQSGDEFTIFASEEGKIYFKMMLRFFTNDLGGLTTILSEMGGQLDFRYIPGREEFLRVRSNFLREHGAKNVIVRPNPAQLTQAPKHEGGINLDAGMMGLQVLKDTQGAQVSLTSKYMNNSDIPGLKPVIIKDVRIDFQQLLATGHNSLI